MDKAIYFVSDHHFGEKLNEKERINKFIEFIKHIKGCESLFIVGDFFDFYFEYKTQIPKMHFKVLSALQSLKESGTSIHYIVGNHDFWTGNFFPEILGICVHKSPIEVTLQNRKIFIAHGNEITRFDFLRWILRNKLSIFLFYWIHPDFAQIIGRCVSTLSTKTRKSIKWERLYKIGEQKFNQGFDAVIFGHIHCPKHIKKSNKDFLLLGDWIRHFSYVRLMDGKFTLSVWKRPSQPSQVLDILYK